MHLKYIIHIFESISGLKINWMKSSLASVGVEEGALRHFTQILGCKVDQWPFNYLGIPLGGSTKALTFWDPVVERVEKKFSCWKSSYISFGGKITLIKTTLANIPVYYMSL